jgi:predicted ferric reductase
MGRVGACGDNAAMESFFALLQRNVLDRQRWWGSHPFSLSEAPDGQSLRITVKALGDYSRDLRAVRPGTRVVAEGPFGVFTDEHRRRDRALLIGGGIGVAPVRALLEEAPSGTVAVVRALSDADVVLRDELEQIARERNAVSTWSRATGWTKGTISSPRGTCASSSPTSPTARCTCAARRE